MSKGTTASTDALRDHENALLIFPSLREQFTPKFEDGKCAIESKLQFPFTCFKLHHPELPDRDQGLLALKTLEDKYSVKWSALLNRESSHYAFHYDAFLDYATAFWVSSLDEYLVHFDELANSDDETIPKFEYVGLRWLLPDRFPGMQFYSLLIHSPDSAMNYELISGARPLTLPADFWMQTRVPRTTFAPFVNNGKELPWERSDNANIIPVSFSRSISDVSVMMDFYVNVMEGTISYFTGDEPVTDDLGGDEMAVRAAYIAPPAGGEMEIVFFERPPEYTYGIFTVAVYEQLVTKSHHQIVKSEVCGIDRWFDNHYGLSTFSDENFLDRVRDRLVLAGSEKYIYRLYDVAMTHETDDAQLMSALYDVDNIYLLWVSEPLTGYTVQLSGTFATTDAESLHVPLWDQQWCEQECPGQAVAGMVQVNQIYIDNGEDHFEMMPANVVEESGDPEGKPQYRLRGKRPAKQALKPKQGRSEIAGVPRMAADVPTLDKRLVIGGYVSVIFSIFAYAIYYAWYKPRRKMNTMMGEQQPLISIA